MSTTLTSLSRLGLRAKLVVAFLAVGLLPAMAITWMGYASASRQVSDALKASAQGAAERVNDTIDRNLFERYGDVQAFASNPVLLNRSAWYVPGAARNPIVEAANTYVALYGLYTVTLVVDSSGRVIAVNDKDAAGKTVRTEWIYERNFADAPWFKDTFAGRYLVEDGSALTGTVVEDAHPNDLAARTYNNDGFSLGFSAPIRDGAGTVIGVWHNVASMAVVDDIIKAAYAELKAKGNLATSFSVMDQRGRVLSAYDPHNGTTDIVRRLNASAGAQGDAPVNKAIAGTAGADRFKEGEGLWQLVGFAPSRGALGYAGLKWGVLVSTDEDIALAAVYGLRQQMLTVLGVGAVAILLAGLALGRSVANPLLDLTSQLRTGTEEVVAAANQVATSAQTLSEGATSQAAALEQTSASMEEMSAMTRQNAENSRRAATLMNDVESSVGHSNQALQQMVTSMASIQTSSAKVTKIIKTIDEIAFQTNILALNAAVEAARAGEAGMGFAVVADEVRNLAQRSAQAARDTSSLIAESSDSATKGGTTVHEVVSAIAAITSNVTEVKRLVDEVSLASVQQAQGIDQVTQAVSQMEKVTQHTAATAEESAAASEELSAQSEMACSLIAHLDAIVAGPQESAVVGRPAAQRPAPRPGATVSPMRPRPVAASRRPSAGSHTTAEDEIPFGDTGTYGRF